MGLSLFSGFDIQLNRINVDYTLYTILGTCTQTHAQTLETFLCSFCVDRAYTQSNAPRNDTHHLLELDGGVIKRKRKRVSEEPPSTGGSYFPKYYLNAVVLLHN